MKRIVKQRRVSKDFESNCLLAVLWLKIRHWRTVKIMRRSAFANYRKYGVFCPHFYAKHDKYEYHFYTDKTLHFPQYFGIFKGYLRVIGI